MKESGDPFLFLNPGEVYEGIDQYSPNLKDFYDPVRSVLPSDWSIVRESIWMYCSRADARSNLPVQGWKLHLSSDRQWARELLLKITPLLIEAKTPFKFAADERIHHLLNCKHWTRGGGGKFVTIYPVDERVFRELADVLLECTREFQGPYILSDRRYRNSKVVFYRYGGFRSLIRVNVRGARDHYLCAPDGEWVKDVREPYFVLPSWVTDPFAEAEDHSNGEDDGDYLQHGRFRIEEAIVFTNAGGIYRGVDTTDGRRVLIKEARPLVQMLGSKDYATDMLAREHRMLQWLAPLGRAVPSPIAYFQDWEHDFLVEDFIEGDTLSHHVAATNILLHGDPTEEERREYVTNYYRLAIAVCSLLQAVHERGVIFGDLSPNNLIVGKDQRSLTLIDLESASLVEEENAPQLFTPGFGKVASSGSRGPRDDYFALGSILASMLFPLNRLFTLDHSLVYRVIPEAARDAGFPEEVAGIILSLLGVGPEDFSSLTQVAARFETLVEDTGGAGPIEAVRGQPSKPACVASRATFRREDRSCDYQGIISGLLSFIYRHIDYSRTDRFFPASSEALWKNPYCLGNGIAGLAEVMMLIEGAIPGRMRDLLGKLAYEGVEVPTGLFSGWAGIACVLWNCGLEERAVRCASSFMNDPMVFINPFFENGLAGAGVAAIYLYRRSCKKELLAFVEEAGERLLQTAEETAEGLRWNAELTDYGLGNGSSGVALFLLYLYQLTKHQRYLEAGEAALQWDLAAGKTTRDGGLSWPRMGTTSGIVYPYWMHGSAGIGEVVVRYLAVTRKAKYSEILDKICRDTCRKYTVMPGLVDGLCGLGQFLVTCAELLDEARFLEKAHIVAGGIQLHLLRRGSGFAVCGDVRARITCDFNTGGAGVAAFLWRLSRGGFMSLFPDEYIRQSTSESMENAALSA